MSLAQQRKQFNADVAPCLAEQVGVPTAWADHRAWRPSRRFAYFADNDRLVIVAGDQEKDEVERAFAYGLGYRQDRKLVLVLPQNHAFATLQRAPWFTAAAQPEIWLHNHQIDSPRPRPTASPKELPSRHDTIGAVSKRLNGQSAADELAAAATPAYLGGGSAAVYALVEWATADPRLDPSHRRSVRAWQCMGQRVLSIQRTTRGLSITAGIHYTNPATAQANGPANVFVAEGRTLSRSQVDKLQRHVKEGIAARLLDGPASIHRRDEHWLQAVIRRDPTLVGVEQPALRELPAWRPRDDKRGWGRGFIDLIGVDGHGDIRVVETKLAGNLDDLLILQGLDYYIWAQAYRKVLVDRLGAPHHSRIGIHYVIGDAQDGTIRLSPFIPAQAAGLGEHVDWWFQTVSGWYPTELGRPRSVLYPPRTLPLPGPVPEADRTGVWAGEASPGPETADAESNAVPATAPFESGMFPVNVIVVWDSSGGWHAATVLYREGDGQVAALPPWEAPWWDNDPDWQRSWNYLAERIRDGQGGNAYSYELDAFEVADPSHITPIVTARAAEVVDAEHGPLGNTAGTLLHGPDGAIATVMPFLVLPDERGHTALVATTAFDDPEDCTVRIQDGPTVPLSDFRSGEHWQHNGAASWPLHPGLPYLVQWPHGQVRIVVDADGGLTKTAAHPKANTPPVPTEGGDDADGHEPDIGPDIQEESTRQRQQREIWSWQVVAGLLSRLPSDAWVIETHPGGGQYDCLTVAAGRRDDSQYYDAYATVVHLNRVGQAHVHRTPRSQACARSTPLFDDLEEGLSLPEAVDRLATMCDADPSAAGGDTEQTRNLRLAGDVVALAAETDSDGERLWEWRNGFLDTSGWVCSVREEYFAAFPSAAEALREPQPNDLAGIPAYRFWFLLRAGKPQLCLEPRAGRLHWKNSRPEPANTTTAERLIDRVPRES